MRKLKTSKAEQGFTLIELVVVVAIVGILLKIALPSYNNATQQSRRTAAKTALLDLASREARYYSTNNAYTATMANLGYSNYATGTSTGSIAVPTGSNYYDLTVTTASSNTTFTGTATAVNSQSSDACGNYTIDNYGNQSSTNTTGNAISCW